MQIVVDFMPSSFSNIECVVKNEEEVEIGRSSASFDVSTMQITCAAFSVAPVVPQGVRECCLCSYYNCDSTAIQLRFDYDEK